MPSLFEVILLLVSRFARGSTRTLFRKPKGESRSISRRRSYFFINAELPPEVDFRRNEADFSEDATETQNCTGAFLASKFTDTRYPRTCRALTAAYPASSFRRDFFLDTRRVVASLPRWALKKFQSSIKGGARGMVLLDLTFKFEIPPSTRVLFAGGAWRSLLLPRTVYHLAIQNVPT